MSLTIPYTVFVHVIEARDLRGKDSNNLSDPYVVVSCHGEEFFFVQIIRWQLLFHEFLPIGIQTKPQTVYLQN